MTEKKLKLIYGYMKEAGWVFDRGLPYPKNGNWEYICGIKELDSDSAWEVVQEMERKGEWKEFYYLSEENNFVDIYNRPDVFTWLMNPDNFFYCFAKWLEGKELLTLDKIEKAHGHVEPPRDWPRE